MRATHRRPMRGHGAGLEPGAIAAWALVGPALLAVTTACGPRERVSLGVRDVTTDVLLSSARPTPSAGPSAPLPPGFPFVPVDVPRDGSVVTLPPLTITRTS